ncbi:Pol [Symbiodinium necroappetens]|uniref:Pol protein n=1 Tax=Symbiodinium necroappetens TaxID=1628268 RepID=A0A812ISB2_9DINO|nr:Pol [Symbiodinium necroappetens]
MAPLDSEIHGWNKIPRNFWEPAPLEDYVRRTVEQRIYLSGWHLQSPRLQLAFRLRCDRLWNNASAFVILYQSWVLLRDEDRCAVFTAILGFDAVFGRAMLNVLCLRQNPALDELD